MSEQTMTGDLIAELERRIVECPTVCHSDRQHLAALTAAVTLAKAADHVARRCDCPGDAAELNEALAIAAKQIGGSDGK